MMNILPVDDFGRRVNDHLHDLVTAKGPEEVRSHLYNILYKLCLQPLAIMSIVVALVGGVLVKLTVGVWRLCPSWWRWWGECSSS